VHNQAEFVCGSSKEIGFGMRHSAFDFRNVQTPVKGFPYAFFPQGAIVYNSRRMVDAAKLERAFLQVVANIARDYWADFNLGSLQGHLANLDKALQPVSSGEIVDLICALASNGHIAVEKTSGGTVVPFDIAKREDENYRSEFFGPRGFRIKITHEGRKAMIHTEINATDNIRDPDEFDDLLPIYRRRIFDADLPLRTQEILQDGTNLVMIMIDLDRFSAVNNSHGHPVGDQVLRGVAKIIEARVRGKGKAYRYGGEEIAVLLPNYTVEEGIALAEAIRKQVEQSILSERNLKVTASLGLACLPLHTGTASDLVKHADEAMYKAKHLGRNLVRAYGEPDPKHPERNPERKQPVPGTLSDEERESIRVTHFSGERARCPKDGMPLRVVKEFYSGGRRTPGIIVTCPGCGLQEVIEGPF
jgi:diguanylate cyclase (GGDEF)-like protein